MNGIVNRLEKFLTGNMVWFFVTGLILLTTNWLIIDFPPNTWQMFFKYFFSLTIAFLPVLLFAGFRVQLKKILPSVGFWALWIICFIVYPISYHLFGIENFLAVPNHDGFIIPIIGGLMLLTEIIILSNEFIVKKTSDKSWVERMDLDRIVLIVISAIITFSTLVPLRFGTNPPEGVGIIGAVWGYIQLLIIGLGFYFFYFVNRHFLIPKLLKSKGIVFYGAGVVAVIVVFYPVIGQIIVWMPVMTRWNLLAEGNFSSFESINSVMNGGMVPAIIFLITTPVIIAFEWFKQSNKIVLLEKEKSQTELNLLKQQINPHFFFNTLNNLYALSLTKDELTSEVILRLSELMRYVIYKGKEEYVQLKDEVNYIEDYLELQRIRLHKRLDFKFEKEIEDEACQVPPLLFINLLENAFKHGIEPAEKECFLNIYLKSEGNNLMFICENSFEERDESQKGSGLENLKRRLELRFPGKHELKIIDRENSYKVILNLNRS